MKLITLLPIFSYVLVTQVAGQKVTSLRSAEGESLKKVLPVEPLGENQKLLTQYGIRLSGDLKGLEEVQIEVVPEKSSTEGPVGKSQDVTLVIEENGEVISSGQTFGGAGPNEKLLEETEGTFYKNQVDFLSVVSRRRCPSRPGFGYANDSFLTIRIFGFRFNIRCGERCCARQWQCIGNQCRWSCGRFTYTVVTNYFVCCSISGRTVDPFPFGRCANRFLCAA